MKLSTLWTSASYWIEFFICFDWKDGLSIGLPKFHGREAHFVSFVISVSERCNLEGETAVPDGTGDWVSSQRQRSKLKEAAGAATA